MTPRVSTTLLAAGAAGVLALSGCGGGTQPAAPSTAPPTGTVNVVASTDVYGSIANAIGGPHAKVTSIIHSPDADPHEYESTPADIQAVSEARIVIANGGGYDDFANKIVDAASTKPTVIDVSQLSGLPGSTDAAGAQPQPAGHDHAEFNEHVWYHLPTMSKLADRLADELSKADPADANTFRDNATAFKAKLDQLTAKLNAIKTAHSGTRVAITEPVPLYLIETAGLTNATPEEFSEAIEEGNDPPAAVLTETLAQFKGPNKVKALLPNAQTESPTTKQVEQAATQAGVPIVKVTETLPAGTTDYVTWMSSQIDQLANALNHQ
jgi:zinc/manganese transport system substrate-binding protein